MAGGVRRAAKVDANHAAVVKELRGDGFLVLDLSAVGKGCPDLLVYNKLSKCFKLIEVKDGSKAPSARRLTEDQLKFHALWPVFIATSPEEAVRAMWTV